MFSLNALLVYRVPLSHRMMRSLRLSGDTAAGAPVTDCTATSAVAYVENTCDTHCLASTPAALKRHPQPSAGPHHTYVMSVSRSRFGPVGLNLGLPDGVLFAVPGRYHAYCACCSLRLFAADGPAKLPCGLRGQPARAVRGAPPGDLLDARRHARIEPSCLSGPSDMVEGVARAAAVLGLTDYTIVLAF